jgi:hypothetical protein
MESTYHNRGLLAYLQDQLDAAVLAFQDNDPQGLYNALARIQQALPQFMEVLGGRKAP